MTRTGKARKATIASLGFVLVAVSCGSSKQAASTTTTATTVPATTQTTAVPTTVAPTTTVVAALPSGIKMRMTIDISPKAVWDDGSAVTEADFKCFFDATIKTPGSLSTVGYDQIVAMNQGTSDHQVVVDFKSIYAPYHNLFLSIFAKFDSGFKEFRRKDRQSECHSDQCKSNVNQTPFWRKIRVSRFYFVLGFVIHCRVRNI